MSHKLIIFCLSIFIFAPAHAEVLDKFGGCRWPSSLWWLAGFVIAIFGLVGFKKRAMAKILFALSGLYIVGAIVWPFLAAKEWIPSGYDQAIFGFYKEIESCPQFELIGYWQTIWTAVVFYLLIVFGLFFASRPSN